VLSNVTVVREVAADADEETDSLFSHEVSPSKNDDGSFDVVRKPVDARPVKRKLVVSEAKLGDLFATDDRRTKELGVPLFLPTLLSAGERPQRVLGGHSLDSRSSEEIFHDLQKLAERGNDSVVNPEHPAIHAFVGRLQSSQLLLKDYSTNVQTTQLVLSPPPISPEQTIVPLQEGEQKKQTLCIDSQEQQVADGVVPPVDPA
jgi:hypothetical protein